MRPRISPVEAIVSLPRLKDEGDRRANWRQALTALGQHVRVHGPPMLDGLRDTTLLRSVQVALETGLVDDLDWFEPSRAAVALYELSSALPPGAERRDLGRRVYQRVTEGTASTFAAVATRMVLGSGRALEPPSLRARVALLFELPIGCSVNPDLLALAIVMRRETFERWIVRASTGPLAARRLAAKLLEHAAREALIRSQQADSFPRQLLLSPEVQPHMRRLLLDREPLVWRHAAVARGLLSAVDRVTREEVESSLDPALSPTEWRRAAVSLVTLVAQDPQIALPQCRRVLEGEIGHNDPGIAAVMAQSLGRVLEAEPDAADSLLERLAATRRPDVAEALALLLLDVTTRVIGPRTSQLLRHVFSAADNTELAVTRLITRRALGVLDRDHGDQSLAEGLRQALVAYELVGARAAHEAAVGAAALAHSLAESLEELDPAEERSAATCLAHLSDLDSSCLERSTLVNLLLLSRRPGESDTSVPVIERLYHRLGRWLLDAEERCESLATTPAGCLGQQRRLRALLHLMDAETVQGEPDEAGNRVRLRLRRATRILSEQIASGPDASVHRILCATLARSFDAAIREGLVEPSDLFLAVARKLTDRESIAAIGDASTNPEVRAPFLALAHFLGVSVGEGSDPLYEHPSTPGEESLGSEHAIAARRVVRLSQAMGSAGSFRGEALRQVMLRLGRALEAIGSARGLTDLVDRNRSGIDGMREVEEASAALRDLFDGAERRLFDQERSSSEVSIITDIVPLSVLVERAITDGVPPNSRQTMLAVTELVADLPEWLGSVITTVCRHVEILPIAAQSDVYAIPLEKRRAPLPDWLLPRRTAGAFYVVRALGTGGVSSVFVARRTEERNNPRAPLFALKVPEYDPSTARSLSEQEFMALFRDEAGALLSLPQHPNLARFVTFDLAARPKPILVMELISGFGLDRLVRGRGLSVSRVLDYLDGILAGLEAMHQVGIGHLDLKPSNVILRDNTVPVLVDFGLSGRKIRPGCGTLDYCAPEVLGVIPSGHVPSPLPADIYAFGSMAFEVLTAQPLFDGTDEMSLVAQHVDHDGWPDKLARLARVAEARNLAVVLAACLRHDPRDRPPAEAVRRELGAASAALRGCSWPLSIEPAHEQSESA